MWRSQVRRPRWMRGPRIEHCVDAPTIHTLRLVLRPYQLSDAADWYRLQSCDSVLRYLPWPKRNEAQSRLHLAHRTQHTRLCQRDDFLALAVEYRGQLIGDVSAHLREVDPSQRGVEVGWILHPDYGGQGFATEAANALLDFCFDRVCARWALASIHPENQASIKLAERLGMIEISRHWDDVRYVLTPRLRERDIERRRAAYSSSASSLGSSKSLAESSSMLTSLKVSTRTDFTNRSDR